MKPAIAALAWAALAWAPFGAVPAAQQPAPPAARATPRTDTPKAARSARAPRVVVRDRSGSPIGAAKVVVTGAAAQQATTGADGIAELEPLRGGTYRLRFEREGFITLERDVTIRPGQPADIEVALSAAPPPPPAPGPPPAAAPTSSVASAPSAPPVFVSIPQFVEKNYIGREPLKESVFGCLADSTTRLLQLHEGMAEHTHADLDEILYVVAGEGTVKVRAQSAALTAGSLSIIPHGQPHAVERKGKNPLILLSIVSGAPCRAMEK